MKDTEKAFHWIITIIERYNINYKISGGLAARIYGANRELADIDIEMSDSDILTIFDDVKSYIVFGPARYKDKNWDLQLMTLQYEWQKIDIAGTEAKIFNQNTKQWEVCPGDLQNIEIKEVFGRRVPIESLQTLIAYKSKLAREVDLEDVRQLKKILKK